MCTGLTNFRKAHNVLFFSSVTAAKKVQNQRDVNANSGAMIWQSVRNMSRSLHGVS